jgi:hypothetical protein
MNCAITLKLNPLNEAAVKATDQLAAHNLAVAQAIAAERERCAKIAEKFAADHANAGEFYIAAAIAKAIRATVQERPMPDPRITDNDAGDITASVDGKEIRGWSYKDAAEQRIKMLMAHEFAEGWFQANAQTRRRSAQKNICHC